MEFVVFCSEAQKHSVCIRSDNFDFFPSKMTYIICWISSLKRGLSFILESLFSIMSVQISMRQYSNKLRVNFIGFLVYFDYSGFIQPNHLPVYGTLRYDTIRIRSDWCSVCKPIDKHFPRNAMPPQHAPNVSVFCSVIMNHSIKWDRTQAIQTESSLF